MWFHMISCDFIMDWWFFGNSTTSGLFIWKSKMYGAFFQKATTPFFGTPSISHPLDKGAWQLDAGPYPSCSCSARSNFNRFMRKYLIVVVYNLCVLYIIVYVYIYILYIPLIKQVKDTMLCVVSLLCTSQSILGRELSLVLWCRMNPPLASRFRCHPESKLTIDDYYRHWSACFFQLAAACCSLPVSPVRLWGLIQVVEGNLVRLNVWVPSWIAISPWAEAEAE